MGEWGRRSGGRGETVGWGAALYEGQTAAAWDWHERKRAQGTTDEWKLFLYHTSKFKTVCLFIYYIVGKTIIKVGFAIKAFNVSLHITDL